MSVQNNHSSLIKAVLTVCLMICCVQANAQFNMLSGEKSSTRWSEINSTNYWVIYPRGLDSLGLKYSTLLEYYHPLVGKSVGYMPNQSFESALPVVLHPYAPVTNPHCHGRICSQSMRTVMQRNWSLRFQVFGVNSGKYSVRWRRSR